MFRKNSKQTNILAFFIALSAAACIRAEDTLKVGDAAPKLYASKWLNGDEVKDFEKGKVYIIECWATWCGPCRAAIPHVSELNTKFKDKGVVFIGMNVWERNVPGVEPFVKQMGAKMNYRVALDVVGENIDTMGKTASAWLAAAGQTGIPCSFVVNKEGKVAWIGHPMGMEKIVEQVVAGTFDIKKQAEMDAKRAKLDERIGEAVEANDFDKLLKLSDELIAMDPSAAGQANMMKVMVLLTQKKKYDDAYALVKKLSENELKDESGALNEIAWTILDAQGIEKRDVDLAMKLALRADELTKHENAPVLDTLARAYFEKGQFDKAVETETLAVAKAGADMKEQLGESLAKYKEAAKNKK